MSQSLKLLTPETLTIHIRPGCPHFRGEIRKYQQADYNIFKALYEFIDNVISKRQTKNVYVDFKFDGNQITNIKISDDYKPGFENIRANGTDNPFNLSHMRSGQSLDYEISQFGIGMKAGAISLAHRMDVYTKVGDIYYHVVMDFLEMAEREDPMESYNPTIKIISQDEFRKYHSLRKGSSIYLSNIRQAMYSNYDKKKLQIILANNITNTYTELLKIKPVNLYLNQDKIDKIPSYFDEPECSIFNRSVKIYKLKNGTHEVFYGYFPYLESEKYRLVNPETGNLKKIKFSDIEKTYFHKNYEYADCFSEEEEHCILLESTFTMYHPNMRTKEGSKENMPRNRIMVYRDGRLYGEWFRGKSNDGNHNFNDTRVIIRSKNILTELGLTFNKHMSQHVENNTYKSLWKFFIELRKGFNANTSTPDNKKLYEKAIEHNISIPDGTDIEVDGELVKTEERRPVSVRKKKLRVKANGGSGKSVGDSVNPPNPTITRNEEDTIRFLYTMIQDFKDHALDDFKLMEANKKIEDPEVGKVLFKIQSILCDYNKKN